MRQNAIRAMALPILIPLASYPPKLAAQIGLGDWVAFLSTPVFVAVVIATLELLARGVERDWSQIGVPLPIKGRQAFGAAETLRDGHRYVGG